MSADRVPDRIALSIDGEQITHAALNVAATQVAAWLAARTGPGDRVLLAARSSLGFVRCYLGALRAGAVVVLANPGYTAAELAHLVTDSAAAVAFADSGAGRLLAGLPNAPLIIDPGQVPAGPRGSTAIVPRPDDTALLAYTSGTTGKPKAVPLTHRALLISIRVAMASWGWREDDVLAHALPLFHQHGLSGVHARAHRGRRGAHRLPLHRRLRPAPCAGTTPPCCSPSPPCTRRSSMTGRATAGRWLAYGSRCAAPLRSPPFSPNDQPPNWDAPRWCVTA